MQVAELITHTTQLISQNVLHCEIADLTPFAEAVGVKLPNGMETSFPQMKKYTVSHILNVGTLFAYQFVYNADTAVGSVQREISAFSVRDSNTGVEVLQFTDSESQYDAVDWIMFYLTQFTKPLNLITEIDNSWLKTS